jgi:hypothetical protein
MFNTVAEMLSASPVERAAAQARAREVFYPMDLATYRDACAQLAEAKRTYMQARRDRNVVGMHRARHVAAVYRRLLGHIAPPGQH